MTTKVCSQCGHEKDTTLFRKHPRQGTQPYCLECQRTRSKQWYADNKKKQQDNVQRNRVSFQQTITAWKQTLKCACCSESDVSCLDLHHKDEATKDYTIAKIKNRVSWTILAREINKCIVLCSNCHRKTHAGKIDVTDIPLIEISAEQLKQHRPRG